MEQPVATAYFNTTLRRFFLTRPLQNLLGLPLRAADFFLRRQKILIKETIREDGSRKKRLIDAGAAEPATPPRSRAYANTARTGKTQRTGNAQRVCDTPRDGNPPLSGNLHVPGAWPDTSDLLCESAHSSGAYLPSNLAAVQSSRPSAYSALATSATSDSLLDNVWSETAQSHAAGASSRPKSIHTPPSDYDVATADQQSDWAENAAGSDPETIRAPRRARPSNPYIEATYGPKTDIVYDDPCVASLLDRSVLERIVASNDPSSLLEELNDVGGLLEDQASILEQSMLSLELSKEFAEDLPASPSPPPPTPKLQKDITVPPLVAPLTQEEFEKLNHLAHEHGLNSTAPLVKLPSTTLTSHDFGTLLPQMFNGDAKGWLNDNIVNEYLELLTDRAKHNEGYVYVRGKGGSPPPVHAFKSQWLASMEKDAAATARWARPMHLLGEKLLECNLVLFPICHHSHWRLLAIKPKDRLIEYYDSLGGPGDRFTQLAMQWVKGVLKEHFVEDEWSTSTEQKSEGQLNASDCGIFTLLNALVLLRGEEHTRVKVTNGMDDARLRVAATLLAKTPTTEMD
ncbi:uncharacterized protein N0V89_007654 [Didymosphaeria variabile]|uniref:Ubiquitin-like protease family profile domain-containing protein n=1 Tax=Didymosphaeria variabile TaxID=1932322 RepID=A0A9W8XKI4_9PLEO|nr:uncharacterized protein N0V89_007654 [Didymosphaeria variabile]KAJ4352306.1 hypothetical protein N0V89_007654 [Didymosphaeria variabile]